jgi:hypothetical protein
MTRSSPFTGPEAKLIGKIPKAEIPNEDLSSKTNPWVEFEKNFRRVAFNLQKTTRSTMQKTVATTKSQKSMKSIVDNPELRNRRDIGEWNSEL